MDKCVTTDTDMNAMFGRPWRWRTTPGAAPSTARSSLFLFLYLLFLCLCLSLVLFIFFFISVSVSPSVVHSFYFSVYAFLVLPTSPSTSLSLLAVCLLNEWLIDEPTYLTDQLSANRNVKRHRLVISASHVDCRASTHNPTLLTKPLTVQSFLCWTAYSLWNDLREVRKRKERECGTYRRVFSCHCITIEKLFRCIIVLRTPVHNSLPKWAEDVDRLLKNVASLLF